MADRPETEGGGVAGERICWQCGETYGSEFEHCPEDGSQLVQLDPTETGDMLIGRVFDYRFRILGKLGEGGMSRVYAARRVEGEGRVALKILKADFLRDPEVRKRFMYEARVISNLDHTNAVDLFDFGQAPDGSFYMVMELLEGESLADRLDGGALTYREIFAFVPPICGVLDEAHQNDVIHRDLKPENIYLAEMGQPLPVPKLLDFGIAKHLRSRTMTKNDQLWGTPAYMSPEQAAGESVAGTADIYAMGVMLYELVSGVLPFRASTAMGFAVKHMHREANPISEIPGIRDVPPRLDEFILTMLNKDVGERPPSMETVARRLRTIRDAEFDERLLGTIPSAQTDYDALEEPEEEEVFTPGEGAGGIEIDESLRDRATELLDREEVDRAASESTEQVEPVESRSTRSARSGSEFETEPNRFDWLGGDEMTPWFRQPLPLAGIASAAVVVLFGSYFLFLAGGPGGSGSEAAEARKPEAKSTGASKKGAYVTRAAGYAASVRIRARTVAESMGSRPSEKEKAPEEKPADDEEEEPRAEQGGAEAAPEPTTAPEPPPEPDQGGGGGWVSPSEEASGSGGGGSEEELSEDNVDEALESTF